MRYMKVFTDFVFRFRKTILVLVALITLFFGWQMTKLQVDSDIINSLPKTDKAVELYNKVGDYFGGNELALVVIKSDDVFSAQTIGDIAMLTEKFKSIDGIASVTSLTDIIDIKDIGGGTIEVGKLIDPNNIPRTKEELEAKRQYALSKEMYDGIILSHDSKSTVIACLLKKEANKAVTSRLIKKAALETKIPEKLFFGGAPFMDTDLADLIFSDLKVLIPIVGLLIILTLFISFGTIRGVVIPLLSVLITNIWILGLMSLLKIPLTVISDVIPVLLIAIGTAPSIHILSKYDEDVSRYGNTDEKTKEAFSEVGWRVIITSLTIVFGFTSFIFGSYLTMIKDFGIFTSIGVVFMLIIAVVFVPAVLSFLKVKTPGTEKKRGHAAITKALDMLGSFVFKNEVLIIVVSIAVFVVSLIFVPKIVRKVDILDYFRPTHPAHETNDIIKNNFGGSRPVQVLINGDIQNPYVLMEMRKIEKFMDYLPNISNSQSVAGLVAEMNDIMDKEKIIPDSRDKVVNLWFFLDGQDIMPQFVDSDKQNALIQSLMKEMDMKLLNKDIAAIDDYIKKLPTDLEVVDTKKLKGADNETVCKLRADNASREISWDAGKKDEKAVMDTAKISQILYTAMINRKVNRDKIYSSIEPLMPASLTSNVRFVNDVKNDISELKQESAAVPKSVYASLSSAKPAPIEEVTFKVEYTGIPLIFKHLDESLLKSQIESFIYAIIFIYILLVLQLRSFVGAFFGLSPILMIVALMFGVMGLTGIPLDIATVLAASVALGIGIDYSIHFSIRFRNNYRSIPDHLKALDLTLNTTGKAIAINVLAVTMGFLTLLFGQLVPLSRLGILVAITMVGSGLGALTLLPSLFMVTKGRFIENLGRMKSGGIKKEAKKQQKEKQK